MTPEQVLPALLDFLDKPSDDPALERFLTRQRIHERPKTADQLEAEGYLDDHEDADDYELRKESEASMCVQSERLGLCFVFETRENYALVHQAVAAGNAPFILEEVAFFAQGVQIYQQYPGTLPGGVRFGMRRNDPRFQHMGPAIGSRPVHETLTDLYLLDGRIVNFGFRPEDELLAHVHVRNRHHFDGVMLNPRPLRQPATPVAGMPGGPLIGQFSASADVQNFLRTHGVDEQDAVPGACPREIMDLTRSLGLTLYFKDTLQGQRLSAIMYKRRGDLGSQGYAGPLPMGFEFGDAPQALWRKAPGKHVRQTVSDELASFYWPMPSGHLIQAVCSLIDWQLYRVFVYAPFFADSVLKD